MDFEIFASELGAFFADSDGAYYVLYAIAACLLTQLVKKIFIDKAKIEILHKFDWTPFLPFIFGLAFAVLDIFAVQGVRSFGFSVLAQIVLSTLAIGALSSTCFRVFKSVSGQSLSSLMKNDVFGVFYTQLLYFGNVRKQIADKKITLDDFINQVKLLVAEAEKIYNSEDGIDAKRCRLAQLLNGIIDPESIEACINVINEALCRLFAKD